LKGEAFFKVKKTAQKSRFIVHTEQLDVIVTGTQFNVLTRDQKTTVLLTEGSVTIHTKDGQELAMKPGDYVEMNGMEIVKRDGQQDNVLAWKENKLAFDNTALSEVARIINHHYGVKITMADNRVSTKSLTGIMPNNNLDDLLKAIEIALDIRITRNGDNIVFSENK
jgi:ferric-dicitrate binding protein FerR (iron transport regulator)